MPRFFDSASGKIVKSSVQPPGSWGEISYFRDIYRTLMPGGKEWHWARFRWDEQTYRHTKGWERVLPFDLPLPCEWHTGARSLIRFGFASLHRTERSELPDRAVGLAVVLPDLPGNFSAANCPGARHAFSVAMLQEGATASYLIEKLMHYHTSRFSMPSHDAAWTVLSGEAGRLDDWTRDACDRVHCLADELSYDLADVAQRHFEPASEPTGFTKKKLSGLRRSGPALN